MTAEEDERKSVLELENAYRDKLLGEEQVRKEESRGRARSGLDSAVLDAARLEKDFRQRLQRNEADAERELGELQVSLGARAARDRQTQVSLEEISRGGAETLAALKRRQDDELRSLAREHKSRLLKLDRLFIGRVESIEAGAARGDQQESSVRGLSDLKLPLRELRERLTADRDKKLKAEIRKMQVKTLRLEKELARQQVEELRRVDAVVAAERDAQERRARLCQEKAAELVAAVSAATTELAESEGRTAALQNTLRARLGLQKEVEDGARAMQLQMSQLTDEYQTT